MFRLLNKRESCKYRIPKFFFDLKCGCLNCIRRKSFYQVLGLNSTASAKDIKSAYYKLCLQFHPDKNTGCPDSVAKFREITEAYEVLSNPEKKRNYDQSGIYNQRLNEYYYKPYYGRKHYQRPYSGRTKDYDYDEHFRQHYDYEKQRQAEYEYFKRRWDAEFHRRYPDREDYFRNQHRRTERDYSYEEMSSMFSSVRRRMFYFLLPFWGFMFLVIPLYNEFNDPDNIKRRGPIYYVVKNKTDSDKHED